MDYRTLPVDLIQILEDQQIQVRQILTVPATGNKPASWVYHRYVLDPGIHTFEELKSHDTRLQAVASALWTPEVVTARKAFLQAQEDARKLRDAAAQQVAASPQSSPPVGTRT